MGLIEEIISHVAYSIEVYGIVSNSPHSLEKLKMGCPIEPDNICVPCFTRVCKSLNLRNTDRQAHINIKICIPLWNKSTRLIKKTDWRDKHNCYVTVYGAWASWDAKTLTHLFD